MMWRNSRISGSSSTMRMRCVVCCIALFLPFSLCWFCWPRMLFWLHLWQRYEKGAPSPFVALHPYATLMAQDDLPSQIEANAQPWVRFPFLFGGVGYLIEALKDAIVMGLVDAN